MTTLHVPPGHAPQFTLKGRSGPIFNLRRIHLGPTGLGPVQIHGRTLDGRRQTAARIQDVDFVDDLLPTPTR